MKRILLLASILFAPSAIGDPVDPAAVILGNDGRYNGAAGICMLLDFIGPDGETMGECLQVLQSFTTHPACGRLRDSEGNVDRVKECGNRPE